jgi:hypothetical protein
VHIAIFFRSQINVAAPFDRMSHPVEHLSIAYESGSIPTPSKHRSNSLSSKLFPGYSNTLNRALWRSSRVALDLPRACVAAFAHETEPRRAAARLASDKDEQASVCQPGAGGSAR